MEILRAVSRYLGIASGKLLKRLSNLEVWERFGEFRSVLKGLGGGGSERISNFYSFRVLEGRIMENLEKKHELIFHRVFFSI